MIENLLKAHWILCMDFNPSKDHLEAFRQKVFKQSQLEENIQKTTEDELLLIVRQISKEKKTKKQGPENGPAPGSK